MVNEKKIPWHHQTVECDCTKFYLAVGLLHGCHIVAKLLSTHNYCSDVTCIILNNMIKEFSVSYFNDMIKL